MYQKSDGVTYSTVEEDNKLVRVKIPAGYAEVCSLLKANEHSLRHPTRRPFVSMGSSYNPAPHRTLVVPSGIARPLPIIGEPPPPLPKASRPVSDKIVDWPSTSSSGPDNFTDDINEDSFSDSSDSTDSETEDRLGTSEAVQDMSPWDIEYRINPDYDDNVSVTSSNEGSVFSISSLASSATDLSKGSGYSAVQIAAATREMLSIFRDDSVLQPLYAKAIHGAIGPRKIVNAFRRLLKKFADRLKDEAQDRLEFLATRLVALKAREISWAIWERCQLEFVEEEARAGVLIGPPVRPDDQDSSDEDEHEETNVDETIFEELTNIREFLIHSAVFRLLQADMQNLVALKSLSEREDKMDRAKRANRIGKFTWSEFQIDTQAESLQSAVVHDCFNLLRHDQTLLELYIYALGVLGEDQFVFRYSSLLRHYYNNAHTTVDSIVDGSTRDDINAQLVAIWRPIASAIVFHLDMPDANESSKRDRNFKPIGDSVSPLLVDLFTDHERSLRYPAPHYLLSKDLALLTLRNPLQQLLSHIPKHAMGLSMKNDTSFLNKTKAFLEDYTMAEWDWWPLAPRVPDVKFGECRLQWKVCF